VASCTRTSNERIINPIHSQGGVSLIYSLSSPSHPCPPISPNRSQSNPVRPSASTVNQAIKQSSVEPAVEKSVFNNPSILEEKLSINCGAERNEKLTGESRAVNGHISLHLNLFFLFVLFFNSVLFVASSLTLILLAVLILVTFITLVASIPVQ